MKLKSIILPAVAAFAISNADSANANVLPNTVGIENTIQTSKMPLYDTLSQGTDTINETITFNDIKFIINIGPDTINVTFDEEKMLEKYKNEIYSDLASVYFKRGAGVITKEQRDSIQFEHAQKVFDQRKNELYEKIKEKYERGYFSEELYYGDNYTYLRNLIQNTFWEYFDKDKDMLGKSLMYMFGLMCLFYFVAKYAGKNEEVRDLKKERDYLENCLEEIFGSHFSGELVSITKSLQATDNFTSIVQEINDKIEDFLNSRDIGLYQFETSEEENESGYTRIEDDLKRMKEIIEENLTAENIDEELQTTENISNNKIEMLECAKNLVNFFVYLNDLLLVKNKEIKHGYGQGDIDEKTKTDINGLIQFIYGKFNELGINNDVIQNCTINYLAYQDKEVSEFQRQNEEAFEALGINVKDVRDSFLQKILELTGNQSYLTIDGFSDEEKHGLLNIITSVFATQRLLKESLEEHRYNIPDTYDLTNTYRYPDDSSENMPEIEGIQGMGEIFCSYGVIIEDAMRELERWVKNKFDIDFNNESLKDFINTNLNLFKIINSKKK